MKRKIILNCLSVILISFGMFTSCMSDVDLSNISDELKIDQSLVLPIGEATIFWMTSLSSQSGWYFIWT